MDTPPMYITRNRYRTHTNNELRAEHVGQAVVLSGWVHARRDHGGLIFVDLRDKWGTTQLTFNPGINQATWQGAERLRHESVIRVRGRVATRPPDMVNPKLATGEVEVQVRDLEVLSVSQSLPFEIAQETPVKEELRLAYRFLDLRHPRQQQRLHIRDQFMRHVRAYMHKHGFTEVQTPILANSSPEGARDFLVPSRLHPGNFYALPQAPQQFKQLLMVAGLDRYFQVAPCFRDEDPRADRHAGEFYQLDLEMSFVEQEDVFAVIEPLMIELTETFSRKKIKTKPFPRLTWQEAMSRYGSDKPDLRYELMISDVSGLVRASNFAVFTQALAAGGVVLALHVPGGARFTRKDIKELTDGAVQHGAEGLAYLLIKDQGAPVSPILKHLGAKTAQAVGDFVCARGGDALFFSADSFARAARALGAVRDLSAEKLRLKDPNQAAWAWVTDFPMYERNAETGHIEFSHNPFTMPQGGMAALGESDPTAILGYQYDLVLNGYEISSGAIRNHRPDIMYRAFAVAGYSRAEVDQKFGALIRAFTYGAPPHGGIAPGLDRLLFILLGEENIREMYAFPKDGKARDVMMNAPSPVASQQLRELHLGLTVPADQTQ